MIAPIPETILLRVTAGLYYDLIPGGNQIIEDANNRFATYCIELIGTMMTQFDVSGEYPYGPKGAAFATPDVLIKAEGQIVIVAECKATRLTYLAQFAENPFEAARQQYTQIAKGIFQLWRFFSHVRRGLVEADLSPECHAVVFTLDAFMQMARDPQNRVFAEANELADKDANITADDRKHVCICPIFDLEFILSRATEASVLHSLKASQEGRYQGWGIREVHRDTGAVQEYDAPKPYPFNLEKVLPWWGRLDELRKQNSADTQAVT
jgi:hypothetical protein